MSAAAAPPATAGGGDLKLSIVIVTWNIRDVLRQCLESLFGAALGVPNEVIVFDNGSSDGTPEMVAAEFPQARLVRHPENLGFAGGNNRAIALARGEYVLLLNSDTVVIDPGIFRPWLEFMDARPDVAMSGCQLVFPDGTHQVGDAGYRPAPATVLCHNLFLSRLLPRLCPGLFVSFSRPPPRLEVDWICGADVLVRRAALPRIGLLDENIFIYAEDIEWGCRVRASGYRVCYLPDLKIVHLQGATTAKYPEQFSGLDLRNLRGIYHALNPGRSMLLYDLSMSAGFLLRFLLYAAMLWRPARYRSARARRMYRYFRFSLSHAGRAPGDASGDMAGGDGRG